MYSYCVSCGHKVEEWEIPEEEWRIVQETNDPVICGFCNMLGEISLDDSSFLVLCDKCGHVWYESDTLVVNEFVLCEDCIDVRDDWSRFEVEPPARSEPQSTGRPRADKTAERPNDLQVGSSPTPPSERTDGESKDPTRATGTGGHRGSIQKNRDALSREPEKDKAEKRTVEQSRVQSVAPLAKQQNIEQGGRTRNKTKSHTKSPVAQNTMSEVPRTGSKHRDGKGCLSGTALIVFGILAGVLMLMYTLGARGVPTRDVAALQSAMKESAVVVNGEPTLLKVPVGMLDRDF